MSRWYRAYEGTVTDAKLGEAALIAGCSRSVSIAAWHCLLESAAARNNCGSFDATSRRVAVILCEPPAAIEALLMAFEQVGRITEGRIVGWQFLRENARPPYQDWVIIRSGVFERDNYTCRYCGERGVKLECDHVIPVSRGGSNDRSNLVTACKSCNRKKRDRTPEEMGWTA